MRQWIIILKEKLKPCFGSVGFLFVKFTEK